MLNTDEIENLRSNVLRAETSDKEGRSFRYADGPLRGLGVNLDNTDTQYLHGWCQLTRSGPVVALYTTDCVRGLCFFSKFDTPGRKPASENR